MGNQIMIWRLAVDLSLVTAILVMAFRWMKASRAQAMLPRTLELEASLRSLISDADAAGRHLNEQLLRREQNLQKLLADVAEAEGRLNRSITVGEDRSKEIQIALDNARDLIAELKESYKEEQDALRRQQMELRSQRRTSDEHQATRSQYSQPPARKRMEAPEPPMFEEGGYSHSKVAPEAARSYQTERMTPPMTRETTSREEISAPRRAPAPSQQRVAPSAPAQEVPRRQGSYQNSETSQQASMQQVYAAAEVLLKQGRKLEQVSAQTRLPVEEVRMLSQMIEIEREENSKKSKGASAPIADSRLGVLGNIRRQTTTI